MCVCMSSSQHQEEARDLCSRDWEESETTLCPGSLASFGGLAVVPASPEAVTLVSFSPLSSVAFPLAWECHGTGAHPAQ